MTLFWKSAVAIGISIAGIGAAAVPANAQYYGGGQRDGWRGDRWDNRGDRAGNWRGHRPGWRNDRGYRGRGHGYRQRCWTEWRYSHYRDRRVRVRICR